MLRSLAVVVAVVAVVIFLRGGSDPDPVRVVDFQRPLADARELAGYPVWGPVGLDDGWRATSARVTQPGGAVVWHVGFVTPDGDYAGLDQSDGPTKEFLDRFAEDARREGSVRLGDRTWRRLGGGAPEPRALWLQEGAAATVVSGGAPWAELEQLARSLRSG